MNTKKPPLRIVIFEFLITPALAWMAIMGFFCGVKIDAGDGFEERE